MIGEIQAGMEVGDFLLEMAGEPVERGDDITDAVEAAGDGPVTVKWESAGETHEASLQPEYNEEAGRRLIGVLPSNFWGIVSDVDENSPASESLQPGDAVVKVNNELVYSDQSFNEALLSSEAVSQRGQVAVHLSSCCLLPAGNIRARVAGHRTTHRGYRMPVPGSNPLVRSCRRGD